MATTRSWVAVTVGMVLLALAGCGSSQHATEAPSTTDHPASLPTSTLVGSSPPPTSTKSTDTTLPDSGTITWIGYHANDDRTGAVPAGPSLVPTKKAWTAVLGGAVYGQAVVADGRIFVATEEDRVVALDPHTGDVLWSTSLGKPLTEVSSVAGCGDIDPLGITSTPAIDTASGTVYVVGELSDRSGAVHHLLEGLNIATGAVTVSDDVDPPLPAGERAVNLLQRASLAVANGRVYVGYGGNYGDCGAYHGWVVAVDETGPAHEVSFEVASDGQGGAIWESGGAPAVDSQGDIYVTTGNANPDPPEGGPDLKRYTESVVKLTPTLVPLAAFKDQVAGGDEDLATGNPVLLPDGDLFAVGKTDIGYVLTQANLSEVAAIKGICDSDPDGGPVYDVATNTVFVPCRGGGIQEVDLTTDVAGPRLPGANGAPILVGTDLWATEYPAGTLTEYDADDGTTLQTIDVGSPIPNFTSPSTALGLLLVATTTGVTAFAGPGGTPRQTSG
jgi:polyvinyl alcohol dehydrogenase (cytochrome)